MKVLVTGGAGYIGSFVCKALKAAGFTPVTYDNLSTGHKENVKWGPFVHGDLLDKEKLDQTIKFYKPVAVMHFAASALVVESVLNPAKYYENNVSTTVNLLESMRYHKVKSIVFSSTCATYGEPVKIPLSESHVQKPISPYGKSKRMVEMILEDYKLFGIEHAALRYFNAAGAALDGSLGEHHEVETHLIPLVIELALGKRDSFTIYGNDFPTKDGTALRDFIHVEDLADAHIKALIYLLQNKKSIQVNLGTGSGHSVLDIINGVEKHFNKKLNVKIASRREKEPCALIADNTKAKKILLFSCKHSDLKTIIKSAAKWHENLLKVKA